MSSKTRYNGLFHRENRSSLSKTKYSQIDQDIYHSYFDQQYDSNSFGFSGNQNEYDIDHLSSKIKTLKDITISIGDEIRESSVFLSSMVKK
ncbi:hypothetical protein T552_02913 [Pneumocystis carinii B80]|uniref:t-SNARE coiled-coil homology domain-containing protein n=1 Tax=Pneumocystis carinii (strain B80) TaxID=1408658 RepID=A0A0W4ZDJ0_PNEC8|nr:hypothetical protein T552_02913 [Pneumocystis carinii B80]KTW26433.1 hypothetical protein T552_02913 [Pneumocystis carinii B80]